MIDLENMTSPMNPPPQFISRRQTPNIVSTGLRLSQGQSQNREQPPSSSSFPMINEDIAGEIKRQSDELDMFLQTQVSVFFNLVMIFEFSEKFFKITDFYIFLICKDEQLRRMLAENSERHYRELLKTTEESVRRRLREKEAEIEKATRRHAELESRAMQIETESRAWQARAASKEAEATTLQARLQQVVAHGGGVTVAEPNSGSVDGVDEAEDAESAYVDPDRLELTGPSCRICWRRSATVLALPCRHLILCKGCDGSVRVCPLCLGSKNSSVEVFFS